MDQFAWTEQLTTISSVLRADDHHLFQQRYRSRRGKDMCRALIADLGTGQLSSRHPELRELGAAGRDLATAVDETRQQAF